MEFSSFHTPAPDLAVAVAVHNGHELRLEIATLMALDEATRLREEDPYTGSLASRFGVSAVVHRSRFEVDLNRHRKAAVYRGPDEAWGLDVWKEPLTGRQVSESLELYDRFYTELASILDELVAEFGGFVLYDIHSYNHRRAGPESASDRVVDSPTVNLGTGSLPERWKPVAEAFVEAMQRWTLDGDPLDVRENVRFQGGHLSRWVHQNYGNTSCALAIELKKVFMDEWTGRVESDRLGQLGEALTASVDSVRKRYRLA
ncbi:MAG TPA: N-formylglutamate amidohydrolase [Acidimicrobiia bacterium]